MAAEKGMTQRPWVQRGWYCTKLRRKQWRHARL